MCFEWSLCSWLLMLLGFCLVCGGGFLGGGCVGFGK